MAKILKKNHYIASPRSNHTLIHHPRNLDGSDGEESRIYSEYNSRTTAVPYTYENGRSNKDTRKDNNYHYIPPPALSYVSRGSGYDDGSEIYVTSGAYKAPSEMSSRYHPPSEYYTPSRANSRKAPSRAGTERSYRRGGLKMEAAVAPNPFCPQHKELCCLLLLFNLGIILVTLGFVIVIQFHDPIIVWILGIIFLIFGCFTLIGSLIYCVVIFREVKPPEDVEDIQWTHHWQKKIGTVPSESHYVTKEKFTDDERSERMSRMSEKYLNRSRY